MSFKGKTTFIKTIDIDKAVRDGLGKGVIATALEIKAQAKALAPVDTANLRSSIDVEDLSKDITTRVGTNVEYGVYQEYGTSKMSAQPFLRPAAELAKGKSIEEVKRWLSDKAVLNKYKENKETSL